MVRAGLTITALVLATSAVFVSGRQRAGSADTVPTVVAARVLANYPHDTSAFTEGLFVRDGRLFESTGLEGQSVIRETDLPSGRVVREATIPSGQFGEGIVDWGADLISVTWQGGVGYRWRLGDFRRLAEFRYPGEGWGLTQDGRSIILSDGTPVLRFMDPKTLHETRRIVVTAQGRPQAMLNELEYVDGEILANIWHDERIARIDPANGRIKGWIDLGAIVRATPKRDGESVPNGIAWDKRARALYVTGKNWPTLYRIAWPAT